MADDVVQKGEEESAENGGGGNKKLFIIIGAVLVVAAVAIVFVMMGPTEEPEDEKSKKNKIPEEIGEAQDETNFSELAAKPLLMVELGEIVCPLRREAVGVQRRKRIKLQPVLVLIPYYNRELQIFDAAQNTAMLDRYNAAKSILRQIVIDTVLSGDPNEEPDPNVLGKRIKKRINNYDANKRDVQRYYEAVFGQGRVQEVIFNIFEPR